MKFDVTVMKIGNLTIEADTAEEAMLFAKTCNENNINWESRTWICVIKRKATRHENYHEQKRPAAYRTCEKHLGIIRKSKEV